MSLEAKLFWFRIATVFLLLAIVLMLPVEAKTRKKQSIDMSPCKVEVRVAGDARPGASWAESAMETIWQKEVKGRFGEAFTVLANARDVRKRCYPGPLKTTRCEMIARPCEVRF
jgi:hypothetical protein